MTHYIFMFVSNIFLFLPPYGVHLVKFKMKSCNLQPNSACFFFYMSCYNLMKEKDKFHQWPSSSRYNGLEEVVLQRP